MRIIFFGSPDDAVQLLGSLITAGHEIAAVYTQPDRRVGRGRTKQATAVKIFSTMPEFFACIFLNRQ